MCVQDQFCRGFIIVGDITDSRYLIETLDIIRSRVAVPIYFVLGNHDYYHSSFSTVSRRVKKYCDMHASVVYLTRSKPLIYLGDLGLAVVGDDGWGDGKNGCGIKSEAALNDFMLIEELKEAVSISGECLFKKLSKLGRDSAIRMRHKLRKIHQVRNVIIVTHVPPFVEASRYNGNISEPDFLPFFSNAQMGEVIEQGISDEQNAIVLCGHTHDAADIRHKGIRAVAAKALYGAPRLNKLIFKDGEFTIRINI